MSGNQQMTPHAQGCEQQQPQDAQQLPGHHRHRQHLRPGAQVSILANLVHKISGRTQALRVSAVIDSVLGPAEPLIRDPAVCCVPVKVRQVQYAGNTATDYLPLDPARVELRLDDPPYSSSHRMPRKKGYWWLLQRSSDDKQEADSSSIVNDSCLRLQRTVAITGAAIAAGHKAKKRKQQEVEEEQVVIPHGEQEQRIWQKGKQASAEPGHLLVVGAQKRQRLQTKPSWKEQAAALLHGAAAAATSRSDASDEASLPSCTPRTPPSTAHFRSFPSALVAEQQEQLQDEQPQGVCNLQAVGTRAGGSMAPSNTLAACLHQAGACLPGVQAGPTTGQPSHPLPHTADTSVSSLPWVERQLQLKHDERETGGICGGHVSDGQAAVVASRTTNQQPPQQQQRRRRLAGRATSAGYESCTDAGHATALAADALVDLFISSVTNPQPVSRRSLAFKVQKPTEVAAAAGAGTALAPRQTRLQRHANTKHIKQGQGIEQRRQQQVVVVSKGKAASSKPLQASTSSSVPQWFRQWHPKAIQACKATSASALPQQQRRNHHRAEQQQSRLREHVLGEQNQRHRELRLQLSRAAAASAADGFEEAHALAQHLQPWGTGSLSDGSHDSLPLPAWHSCKRRSSGRRNRMHSKFWQENPLLVGLPAATAASLAGGVAGRAALEAAGLLDVGAAAAFLAAHPLPEVQQWQGSQGQQEQLPTGGSLPDSCCGTMLAASTSCPPGLDIVQGTNAFPHGQLGSCQVAEEVHRSTASQQLLVQAARPPLAAPPCQTEPIAAPARQLVQQQQQLPELQSLDVPVTGTAAVDKRHMADDGPLAAAAVQGSEMEPQTASTPAEASVVLLVSMLKRVQQLTLYSTGMATQLAQLRGALDGSSNGEGSGNAAPAAGDELCPGEQQQLLSRLASCQEQQRRLHQQLQQMASVLVPYTSRGSTTPASQAAVYSATTQLKQLHNQMHEQLQHLVQAIGDLATAVLTAVAAPKPDKPDELEASAAAADSVAKADWVAMLRSCLCAACDHLHRALELV